MTQQMFTFTYEMIDLEGLGEGRHVVKVTPGGAKILAHILDGKVTRYEAEDSTGNRQALFMISQDIPQLQVIPGLPGDRFCHVCTYDEVAGAPICFDLIECPPIPGKEETLPQ